MIVPAGSVVYLLSFDGDVDDLLSHALVISNSSQRGAFVAVVLGTLLTTTPTALTDIHHFNNVNCNVGKSSAYSCRFSGVTGWGRLQSLSRAKQFLRAINKFFRQQPAFC